MISVGWKEGVEALHKAPAGTVTLPRIAPRIGGCGPEAKLVKVVRIPFEDSPQNPIITVAHSEAEDSLYLLSVGHGLVGGSGL